jgi:hypothetical protein
MGMGMEQVFLVDSRKRKDDFIPKQDAHGGKYPEI